MAATDDSRFHSKTQYEVTLERLAQVTGRTLGANSDNTFKADLSSSDRVLGSWTHPTNGTTGAKTLNASNQVIKTLVFDKYGHVTGATQGALVAADIPDLSATYQTKYGFTITGTANATYNLATISSNASNGNTAYGYFSSGVLPYNHGGTGLSSYTKGDILYASANNTLAKLAANTTATRKFLSMASSVPSWTQLYVGRTEVATSAANVTLLGIDGFTNTASASTSNDKSLVVWDADNNAWHFKGNLYADGWVSALGAGSGSGGGGVDGIDILRAWADYSADDETQVLGSNLAYNMNQRITALENSATSVTFAQTLTSGKEIGTLTIDGASVKLYAPASYALSDITGADDLKAIEAITGTSGVLQKTAANTWSLISKTDSSSASAISTGTGLVTERDVYYGLPKINNAHNYTSSSAYYAPTSGGTAGYLLKANGSTSAPTWDSVANIMSAYATTAAMNDAIEDAIAGVTQIDYVVSWNGSSAPTVANIPAGVKVVYNGTTYTGTMATGTKGTIYLVYSSNGLVDSYDEYMYFTSGGTNFWERLGSFGETNLADYWLKNDLVAITATENTTLLNSYFPA